MKQAIQAMEWFYKEHEQDIIQANSEPEQLKLFDDYIGI